MKILINLSDEERRMYKELENGTQSLIREHFDRERSKLQEHRTLLRVLQEEERGDRENREMQRHQREARLKRRQKREREDRLKRPQEKYDGIQRLEEIEEGLKMLGNICTVGVDVHRTKFKRATGHDIVKKICDKLDDLKDSNKEYHICPICQQDEPKNLVIVSCCQQFFCQSCIVKHLEKKLECPLCRAPLTPDDILEIPICVLPKPLILAALPSKLSRVIETITTHEIPGKKSMILSRDLVLSEICPNFREALDSYGFRVFELEKFTSKTHRRAVIRDFNASSSKVDTVLIANLNALGPRRERSLAAQTKAKLVCLLQPWRSFDESTKLIERFGGEDVVLKMFLAANTIEERGLTFVDSKLYYHMIIPIKNEHSYLTNLRIH